MPLLTSCDPASSKQKVCSKRTIVKYLTNEEIQILLAQSNGELSDLEDSDFENVIEDNADKNVIEALMVLLRDFQRY
ncbi:hypothetical protein JTE90_024235 [Oedothorax gibbosus]|uniref:Uncharacterized protein n=1 Tax=Oedothorax gibbosus TaxID=931172 RepID=A0AAV6TE92_9ARAC|nr:hypothetical protein JTE90_024235 [Oedothorax gibbosus]